MTTPTPPKTLTPGQLVGWQLRAAVGSDVVTGWTQCHAALTPLPPVTPTPTPPPPPVIIVGGTPLKWQAAIDAAPAGGTIVVPACVSPITGVVSINKPLIFVAETPGKSIAMKVTQPAPAPSTMFDVGAPGVTWDDGIIFDSDRPMDRFGNAKVNCRVFIVRANNFELGAVEFWNIDTGVELWPGAIDGMSWTKTIGRKLVRGDLFSGNGGDPALPRGGVEMDDVISEGSQCEHGIRISAQGFKGLTVNRGSWSSFTTKEPLALRYLSFAEANDVVINGTYPMSIGDGKPGGVCKNITVRRCNLTGGAFTIYNAQNVLLENNTANIDASQGPAKEVHWLENGAGGNVVIRGNKRRCRGTPTKPWWKNGDNNPFVVIADPEKNIKAVDPVRDDGGNVDVVW